MEDFLSKLNTVVTQLCSWASNENLNETERHAILAALSPVVEAVVVPVVIVVNAETNGTFHALVAQCGSQNPLPLAVVSEEVKQERRSHSCFDPSIAKPVLRFVPAPIPGIQSDSNNQAAQQATVVVEATLTPTPHNQPTENTSGIVTETESDSSSGEELMSVSDHEEERNDVTAHNTSPSYPGQHQQANTFTTIDTSRVASVTPTTSTTSSTPTPNNQAHPAINTPNHTTPAAKRSLCVLSDTTTDTTMDTMDLERSTSSAKRQRYKTDKYNPDAPVRVANELKYQLSDKYTKEFGTSERANRSCLQDLKFYYDKGWKRQAGKGDQRDRDVYVNPKGVKYGVKNGCVVGRDFFLTPQDAWEYCSLNCVPINPLPVFEDVAGARGTDVVTGDDVVDME